MAKILNRNHDKKNKPVVIETACLASDRWRKQNICNKTI